VPDDHLAEFSLNGASLPDVVFDGESVGTLDTTVSQSSLLTDPSTLEITAAPVFDGPTEVLNEFILNDIEVTYRRSFDAGASSLEFDFPDGDAGFAITDLPDPDVLVYELTASVGGSQVPAPVLLTGWEVTGGGSSYTSWSRPWGRASRSPASSRTSPPA